MDDADIANLRGYLRQKRYVCAVNAKLKTI